MTRDKFYFAACLLILLCSCSGSKAGEAPLAYGPPTSTPYARKPHLEEQYIKAHEAAWQFVVTRVSADKLARCIAQDGASAGRISMTCCEATRNVTLGWYKGLDDGTEFIRSLIQRGRRDPSVVPQYKALLERIARAPVKDWYVFDGYDPRQIVKEVKGEADVKVEISYRDATKSKLLEVLRYKNGKLDGLAEQYDGNGELQMKTPYKEGVIHGVQVHFSDSGVILGRTPFRLGKKHGIETWYNEGGELTAYREWQDGRQHGRDIEWNDNRGPYRFQRWKNGKKHGLCVYYQSHGRELAGGCGEYEDGKMTTKLKPLTSVEMLPSEYQRAALKRFRQEHPRNDVGEVEEIGPENRSQSE